MKGEKDEKKVCRIVGAGEMTSFFHVEKGDFIIAADGGLAYLNRFGVSPDLILGDFDSLSESPAGENVLTFPVEKDDTDMMLAVKEGLSHGCEVFFLYGGVGGRLDHTLANIQTLCFLAEKGKTGILVGEKECLTALQNGSVTLSSEKGGTVSVFSAGDRAEGVFERGVKYAVENVTLTNSFPLGVSNSLISAKAEIGVKNGMLVILWETKGGKNRLFDWMP